MKLKSPVWSLLAVMLMVSLTGLCLEAQARGGGGGYGGGSFRGGGGYATGPRGGAVAVGPRGGAVAEGPGGRGGQRSIRRGRGGRATRGDGLSRQGLLWSRLSPLRRRRRKGGGGYGAGGFAGRGRSPVSGRSEPTIMTAAPITRGATRELTSITVSSKIPISKGRRSWY